MYNFKHWKEAYAFLMETKTTELQKLKIEDKKDAFYLRSACIKFKNIAGVDALDFSYSDDLSEFEFKFNNTDRFEIPSFQSGLQTKINAMAIGDKIDINSDYAKTEAVRAIAYKIGYSVTRTPFGCVVEYKGDALKLRSQLKSIVAELKDPGVFYDLACDPNLISSIRVYVSQFKDKAASFSVKQIGDKTRITKVK